MGLTYCHEYSYESKYNPIGGNASINLITFRQIIRLFS